MNPSEKHFQANRVLNSKCHYEVLGISRGANKKEIRKAFREMALQYHPDKNELPQAKDVFHKIVSAYEVLEDDNLKKEYDQKRNKANQPQQPKIFKQQFSSQKHSSSFKTNPKPSNFKRNFQEQFKRQFRRERKSQSPIKEKREQQFYENKKKYSPQRPTYKSQYIPQKNKQQSSRTKNCQFLLVLIVFIIIFYFSPFNNRSIQDRHLFSLTPTALHTIKMKTQKIKAPYYIKSMQNTNALISQQLVQRMYVRRLQKQCQNGLNQRQSFKKMAAKSLIISVQSTYLNMAERVDIQSCKKIIKLLKKYPFIQLSIFSNNLQL